MLDLKQKAIENIPDPAPTQEDALSARGCFLNDFTQLRSRLPLVPCKIENTGYYLGISPRRGAVLLRIADSTSRRTYLEARQDVAIWQKTGVQVVFTRSLEDLILLGFDCSLQEVEDE